MKLDKFINRPVLSTVISILIVILGAIGLATLPITQYPDIAPPYRVGKGHLYGCQRINRIELRHRSVGGTDQWCRKHDVYDINCIQYGFR